MRYGWLLVSVAGMMAFAVPALAQDKAIDKGQKVFAAQKCAMCHSVAGKGNPKGPIEEGVATLSSADIRGWLVTPEAMRAKTAATRKPAMKAYTALPKEDLDALVAYLLSLKPK